jgi:dTMP kinase
MLVTLEGLDGSGKTTVWEALRDVYPDAVFTCEPTETWYGEAVRRSLSADDADPVAELFLYTADHAAHLSETVRPALEEGRLVISDRYSDSRYAYQGAALADVDALDRPMEYVRGIHQPFTRPPERTIYLDVDPETALARSDRADKFETREHLRRVRDNYERLIDNDERRFYRIDATQAPETIIAEVEDVLATWTEMFD